MVGLDMRQPGRCVGRTLLSAAFEVDSAVDCVPGRLDAGRGEGVKVKVQSQSCQRSKLRSKSEKKKEEFLCLTFSFKIETLGTLEYTSKTELSIC